MNTRPDTDQQALTDLTTYIDSQRGDYTATIGADFIPTVQAHDSDRHTCLLRYQLSPEDSNPMRTALHGGLSYHIMQTSMQLYCSYCLGRPTTVQNMQIAYLRPVPCTSPVYIRVHLNKAGRGLSYLTAEALTDQAPDKILLTATATFR